MALYGRPATRLLPALTATYLYSDTAIYSCIGSDTIQIGHKITTVDPLTPEGIYRQTLKVANKLFAPLLFEAKLIPSQFKLYKKPQPHAVYRLDYQSYIAPSEYIEELRDSTLKYVFLHHPSWVEGTIYGLPSSDYLTADPLPSTRQTEELLFTVDRASVIGPPVTEKATINQRKWKFKGKVSLQVAENYVSPNWYQGGGSNLSALWLANMEINYHNRTNLQWDNSLDMKLGFYLDSFEDRARFNVNNDMFKVTSKLGYKAYKALFYSTSFEFLTQMMAKYNADGKMSATLLSPGETYLNIGLDIKGEIKKRKFDYSIAISPLSYKMKFVLDTAHVNPADFGIQAGKNTRHEIGSRLTAKFKWEYAYWGSWESKAYFFTNYTNIDTEWETILNFRATRFLTTRIYLNLKYDDSVAKVNPDWNNTKIQMQQSLSFGVVYWW